MLGNASLSLKLIRIGFGLLVVALASIGLTLWVTWQLEGGAAAVNEAGRLRMQTWRLASLAQAASSPQAIAEWVQQFDDSLHLLRQGDPTRPLFVPWDAHVHRQFAAVDDLWQTQRGQWLAAAPVPAAHTQQAATEFVRAVDGFVSAIETQLSGLTAVLNLFQFVMMGLAIGAAVVMLYTGYLYVIGPLDQLKEGLEQVEAGDFAVRMNVGTQDEFGQVTAGFNRMAEKLQSLYGDLEAQVEAKTRDIEAQRQRLAALYEVSAFLAEANTMSDLSKGFAQRVRAVIKADAVVVRWSDEANQRYLLLASDCLPEHLEQHERSLVAGACACGNLQPHTRIRVIPIRQLESPSMRLCARIGYETVVSVPVRLQQRLLGEIDLFFFVEKSLSLEETELLDALGSHLASAMEGLRAAALEREAAVAQERSLLARELHDSIAQSLAFLKIQSQLLRVALNKHDADKTHAALEELDQGLRESISDVRELLIHFRTRTNSDDIANALQETLQKFQHQTSLPARLEMEGDGLPLPADVQVQVLHIIQEALSNVRKHSQASHVSLEVSKGPAWRFVVRDNGIGFDTLLHREATHVGQKIMQERAQRIGATVTVESTLGRGTAVVLTLPAQFHTPAALAGLDWSSSAPMSLVTDAA
jgi:two-component system nitrate/nitrite sensor histidine kinase NarX